MNAFRTKMIAIETAALEAAIAAQAAALTNPVRSAAIDAHYAQQIEYRRARIASFTNLGNATLPIAGHRD